MLATDELVKANAMLEETERTMHSPMTGVARYYTVRVGGRSAEEAAWLHTEPAVGVEALADLVAFRWNRMDARFEEGDEVFVHPRDPYHRSVQGHGQQLVARPRRRRAGPRRRLELRLTHRRDPQDREPGQLLQRASGRDLGGWQAGSASQDPVVVSEPTFPTPSEGMVATMSSSWRTRTARATSIVTCSARRLFWSAIPRSCNSTTPGSSSTWAAARPMTSPASPCPPRPIQVWQHGAQRAGGGIATVYDEIRRRGGEFMTPPIDCGAEIRCYLCDPDGYIIEFGQSTRRP